MLKKIKVYIEENFVLLMFTALGLVIGILLNIIIGE